MEVNNLIDFKKHVKNIKSPILISGQEYSLINLSIEEIYNQVNEFKEMNINIFDGDNLDFDTIYNACETSPFISNLKIVHIKNFHLAFNNTTLINNLTKYINNIPSYTILLLTTNQEIEKNNNFIRTIRATGLIAEYKKLKGTDFQNYVYNYLKERNKNITKANLTYLISEIGSSSENIDFELEKLISYLGNKDNIEKDDIENIIHKSIESNVFKMNDLILKKDIDNAILIYKNMIFQGEDELKILAMIFRNYKILYLLKSYIEANMPYDDVVKKYNLRDFALKNYIRVVKVISIEEIEYGLKKCFNCDVSIKLGEIPSSIAIENLIIELCA
ncbi:MAG: DNA polymerase III subunit delta [Clostridiales bacterium]|nr:DNA polymerase III subunit delta [Clostridiales bacterium]